MPKGRILTPDERLVIAREAAKGADIKGLAHRFGVTRRTIHYTIKREKDRRRDTGIRTAAASVTHTERIQNCGIVSILRFCHE